MPWSQSTSLQMYQRITYRIRRMAKMKSATRMALVTGEMSDCMSGAEPGQSGVRLRVRPQSAASLLLLLVLLLFLLCSPSLRWQLLRTEPGAFDAHCAQCTRARTVSLVAPRRSRRAKRGGLPSFTGGGLLTDQSSPLCLSHIRGRRPWRLKWHPSGMNAPQKNRHELENLTTNDKVAHRAAALDGKQVD